MAWTWLNGWPWIEARGAIPVALINADGSTYDSSGGFSASSTATPTNTAYGAGDVMGAVLEFENIGPAAGGEVLVTGTLLQVNHTALIASEAGYDLHLYSAQPSAIADNAAWDFAVADRALYLGKISLGTPVDLGNTLRVDQTGVNKQVTVPAGGSLFGYLVTAAGFTPTAAARVVTLKTAAL